MGSMGLIVLSKPKYHNGNLLVYLLVKRVESPCEKDIKRVLGEAP